MPESAAGPRVDPPVSDPRPQVTMPAAMAAAVQPDEPPGIRVLSYGFFTGPANDDRLVLVMPNASSCMLALPIMMTPAFKSFCSDGALPPGCAFCSAGVPPDVGISAVVVVSFTKMGRPANGRGPGRLHQTVSAAPPHPGALFRMSSALRALTCPARAKAAFSTSVA